MLRRSFLVFALLALSFARPHAQVPRDLSNLLDSSTVIAAGRVVSVSSAADDVAIYTYVTLEVTDVLKGAVGDRTIVIKQIGGSVGGLSLYINGQARFSSGDQVVVFLAVRPRDRTLYTAGLSRGVWQLAPSLRGGAQTAMQDSRVVDLAELRGLAARSAPRSESFVTRPVEMTAADPGSISAQFTFLPDGPARWHEADEGARIPVDYASNGIPAGGIEALDSAISAWNGVGTTLELERAQTGPGACGNVSFSGNGRITFLWDDPCMEMSDSDGVTFGVGGGYFTPGHVKTVNGVDFQQFLQGFAILNNAGPHIPPANAACLRDAATHVLGHAVGLGHSSDSGAVMYATLRSACASGTSGLAADDIAGLRAIYPELAGGVLPPNPPVALTAQVTQNVVVLDWTPASSGGEAQSYVIEAGSAPGLANLAVLPVPSSPTMVTVTNVPPGVYHVRVRARNVLGTSAASPETIVTVGPCTAPAAPSGLSYTAVDNFVSLTWSPPASGGPFSGYVLSAGYAAGQSNALVMPLGPTPGFTALAPPGQYYVRVQAANGCGVGPATPDLLVTVQACSAPPSAPRNLSFTKSGAVVTLQWEPPTSGFPTQYVIVVGSVPGGADLLVLPTGNAATTFTATAPAGTYYVKVQAVSACGFGPMSNEVSLTVP